MNGIVRGFWSRVFSLAVLVVGASQVGAQQQQVVTVYSSRSHYGSEPVFEAFTRETGIRVEFFQGNNNEVLERLRSEGRRSPADVLLTVDAGNLWYAAEQGLLQPVRSAALERNIPAYLRDPGESVVRDCHAGTGHSVFDCACKPF
jgi:iron(III) transport system substrate-binding protein